MHPVKAHLARLMVSCRKRIIRDGNRAGEVVARIRAFFKKAETAKGPLDLNETIREVIDLARSEMENSRIVLRLELARDGGVDQQLHR
jgi:nitrogen fixation/metabolism regulation signal transduction histidine kinase